MIGCETYAEYIDRISGDFTSTRIEHASLSKAYVEGDLDGWR